MDATRVKQLVFRSAQRLGVGDRLLDVHRSRNYDVDVDPRIPDFQLAAADRRGHIALPMVKGIDPNTVFVYAILAHAFRTRGYEPLILHCASELDLCHGKSQRGFRSDEDLACSVCEYYGRNLLDTFGHDFLTFRDVLPDHYSPPAIPDPADSTEYRGVPVGRYAKASARKYLKKYHLDSGDGLDDEVFRRYLRSAILLVDAAEELFRTNDVVATVAHHPTYINGGLFMATAEKHGIPASSFEFGYQDGTLLFGNQENISPLTQYADLEHVRGVLSNPLDREERARIDRFLRQRASKMERRFTRKRQEEANQVEGIAGLATADDTDGATTVGVFTNLIWDASINIEGRELFDPFVWVETTLRELSGEERYRLIVKTHPSERIYGTNEAMGEWIRERFTPLPSNVRLLEPDSDVSLYQLMPHLDLGVVYNSTSGIEMACEGIPVVVVGETHYKGLGFTFDPDTVDDYLKQLADTELSMTDEMVALARRYAYFLFVRKHIDFPFYQTDERNRRSFGSISHDDIRPGNENLDRLVRRIIGNEPVTS